MMLEEAKQMVNEDGVADLINCSNADGITALHQVKSSLLPALEV